MSSKTCGVCRKHNIDCLITPRANACEYFEPKPITNGDVIRQMSNEKLAELFDNSCKVCAKDIVECDTDCVAGILAWLNAPAESEGGKVSKRNDIICDICGMTVATIEGAIIKKALTTKPYIIVPFHFVRTVVDEWDLPEKEYCKGQKHICIDCYNHIARELKLVGGGK